jgi:hypothetical protein
MDVQEKTMEKMTFEEFQETRWVSPDARVVTWASETGAIQAEFVGAFSIVGGTPLYEYVECNESYLGELRMCERLAYQWYKEN